MHLVKMKRADGAEAHVEPQDVETWCGYGFEVESGASPSAPGLDPAKPVEEAPSPLDHDGDGEKGGSVRGYHSTRAKGARKRGKGAK